MNSSHHVLPDAAVLRRLAAVCAGALAACLLLAPAVMAGEPSTVTVRVEGSSATLLGPTQVTTTTAPVVKDGNPADSCPGTNASGALELATKGNWQGSWYGEGIGYSVETILGESHLFSGPTYWEFWLDNAPAAKGVCEQEIKDGDTLLFFPGCYGTECPAPSNPLGIEAPTVAEQGSPVQAKVTSYENGTGTPSPAAGATVSYEGRTTTTDASGLATLTFASTGEQEVKVTAPSSIRTETTVCVHNGDDGNCGTTAPAGTGGVESYKAASAPYRGPFALVADVTTIHDGELFRHGQGPRILAGQIDAHSTVTSVDLALRRSYRGRCSAYDGTSERFVKASCGHDSEFKAATAGNFSYLLPARLGPGRYVLDVTAMDLAGNTLALARGTSRLVFFVR
jgi:hypothetical protein